MMDEVIDVLIKAGYFRAQIGNLSDFDKVIGGIAWAMQVFSYDLNIDIFYTDSLDLGQKIALTERLVMVLRVMKCPHLIEPHQIVGLDYANLLPLFKWLIKRSEETRAEHEAFNRLLALRHFHRVTNCLGDRSNWCHVVPIDQLYRLREKKQISRKSDENIAIEADDKIAELSHKLLKDYKDNKHISFLKTPSLFVEASSEKSRGFNDTKTAVEPDQNDASDEEVKHEPEIKVIPRFEQVVAVDEGDKEQLRAANKELDTELLATNQKILNLLKKLDSMPSETEIAQYQKRYIELHQQIISKNKDVKKIYALFNSLQSTKHYLTREINLLESIASNLDLTESSASNRDLFMRQFQDIIGKIQSVKEEVLARLDKIKEKCAALNIEYASLADIN